MFLEQQRLSSRSQAASGCCDGALLNLNPDKGKERKRGVGEVERWNTGGGEVHWSTQLILVAHAAHGVSVKFFN